MAPKPRAQLFHRSADHVSNASVRHGIGNVGQPLFRYVCVDPCRLQFCTFDWGTVGTDQMVLRPQRYRHELPLERSAGLPMFPVHRRLVPLDEHIMDILEGDLPGK